MTTETLPTQKSLNGIDLTRMEETGAAIQNQPELAQFKFRATNQWQDGAHNKIRIGGYYGVCEENRYDKPFELDADEPTVLLGKGQAANPAEYLLTALSSCMTTSIVFHAAAQGIKVDQVESEYEGDIDLHGFLGMDPEVRKGYKEIRVRFKVKSDADKEKLQELAEQSPMWDAIRNPTPIKVEFVTA